MIKPKPEDFGALKEEFDLLEPKIQKINIFFISISVIVSLCVCCGLYIISLELFREHDLLRLILVIYIGCCAGILTYAFLQAILKNFSIYQKHSRYKESLKKYEAWKHKAEKEREYKELRKKRKQENYWKSLTGNDFEKELSVVYKDLGYKVSLTPQTGDKGVDINLEKEGKRIIVQCKAHKQPVGVAPVRELFGSLHHFKSDEAILASVSGFTSDARAFAKNKPIILISVEDIIKMQHSIKGR